MLITVNTIMITDKLKNMANNTIYSILEFYKKYYKIKIMKTLLSYSGIFYKLVDTNTTFNECSVKRFLCLLHVSRFKILFTTMQLNSSYKGTACFVGTHA